MIKVVGALIIKNNTFLITKRAYGELKGMWEFPGGKIHANESVFEAIQREIHEELGLMVVPQEIVDIFEYSYSFNDIHLTLIKCRLQNDIQSISSDGSHSEYKWITLKKIDLVTFAPLDKKIAQFLIKDKISL